MSALAARRAAAAASSIVAAVSPAETPGAGPSRHKKRRKASSPSKSPSVEPTPSLDGFDDDGPPQYRPRDYEPHVHRSNARKVRTPSKLKQATRYFVPEADSETPTPVTSEPAGTQRTRRRKAFSPSMPVSESQIEDDDQASNSSDEDSGSPDRQGWTGSVTHSSAGPSRSIASLQAVSSGFAETEGRNVARLSREELKAFGFQSSNTDSRGVVLLLAEADKLLLVGIYRVCVLRGTLSLGGKCISASDPPTSHSVFAPTSHPVPELTALSRPGLHSPRRIDLTSNLPLPSSFAKDARHTVVLIQEDSCGLLDVQCGAVSGFSSMWPDPLGSTRWGLRGVNPVVGSISAPVYLLSFPKSWDQALSSSVFQSGEGIPDADSAFGDPLHSLDSADPRPPVLLVRGLKRSGKSTFARSALNALLGTYRQVAWLECDLGQGEFGCGGVVGLWVIERPLFGPPFTHPILPLRAHFLGTYTPTTCPHEYIEAIRQLVDHYRYDVDQSVSAGIGLSGSGGAGGKKTDIPLIVNTQGWVKGLGEELLHSIEQLVQPSHIFTLGTLNSEPDRDDAPGWTHSPPPRSMGLDHTPSATHVELDPAPESPLQARYTPADLRTLATIAYFHARFAVPPNQPVHWDFERPLLACPPWSVTLGLDEPLERVYLIGEGAEGVLAADLSLALSGSIVALLEPLDSYSSLDDHHELYIQGRQPPPHTETNFLGLAIIRALRVISSEPLKMQLHLISPLPAEILQRAKIIVKNGAMELPLCGMLNWRGDAGLADAQEMPFLDASLSNGAVGGEKRRFRRNLMRKGM